MLFRLQHVSTAREAEQQGRRQNMREEGRSNSLTQSEMLRSQPEPGAEQSRALTALPHRGQLCSPAVYGGKANGTELKGTNASNRWIYLILLMSGMKMVI